MVGGGITIHVVLDMYAYHGAGLGTSKKEKADCFIVKCATMQMIVICRSRGGLSANEKEEVEGLQGKTCYPY